MATAASDPLHVRFGEFELDQGNARLLRAGSPIALAPTPFELLCALARQPGAMLTKHALLDVVWGHRFVSDSVLKGAISDIRNALEDDPRQPRFIETVPRRGYRFVGRPVAMQPAAPGELAIGGERRTGHDVLGAAKGGGFVGRDAELAALERAWARANTGRRTLAWVAGEPGIGKTTLVEHFIAGFEDISCARGSCVQSFGAGEPYHAILEALSELGRRDDAFVPMLRDIAPTWLLQLPWLSTAEMREALQRELVGVHPERMLRELGEFLDRYTEHRPLLLVTEDLHWADRATTQLIDYIARRRGSARFMWLATFRLTEVIALDHPLGALRHELRLAGLCEEIVLDSFSEQETAAFLAARAPALAEDEAFVRALHDRTEGVPLFVASMADDVTARVGQGSVPVGDLSGIPLPQGLTALIDHYLGRLDAGRRALLGAASVCGTRFRVETLATVLERDVLDVSDTCDALVREQGWLVATPESQQGLEASDDYAFRHALYRQAVLDRTTPPVRVELHRRVAVALERERDAGADVTASALAAHFDQGRQPMSALGYYAEAAQAALQHLRPGECLALSERALWLIDQVEAGPERAGYELTLGTLRGVAAFQALGAGQVSRDAFARAAARLGETHDHPMRGLLLHGFGFLLNLRAEYDEALLTAARAEALGEATDDALLIVAAGTVQGQAHMAQGRHEAARRALERILPAVASLEEASETRLLGFIADPQVTARAMLSLPLMHLGLVQQARAHLDAAHARARSLGQPIAVMVAIWLDALVEVRLGNAERVASLAAEMLALVEEYALAQGRTASRFFQGWAESRLGQPREGYRRIREACDENVALGMLSGTTETLTYAAEALIAAGDYGAAQAHLDEALGLVERHDERICLPQLHLIDAAIARHRNNAGRADAAIRSAIEEARRQASPWLELLALTTLVEQGIPVAEDIDALAALVARLVEAQDTLLVARARALLAGRLPHS